MKGWTRVVPLSLCSYLFLTCIPQLVWRESTTIRTHKRCKLAARRAGSQSGSADSATIKLTVSPLALRALVCAQMTHPDNSVWYSCVNTAIPGEQQQQLGTWECCNASTPLSPLFVHHLLNRLPQNGVVNLRTKIATLARDGGVEVLNKGSPLCDHSRVVRNAPTAERGPWGTKTKEA